MQAIIMLDKEAERREIQLRDILETEKKAVHSSNTKTHERGKGAWERS
jgi:hypothetical protein